MLPFQLCVAQVEFYFVFDFLESFHVRHLTFRLFGGEQLYVVSIALATFVELIREFRVGDTQLLNCVEVRCSGEIQSSFSYLSKLFFDRHPL